MTDPKLPLKAVFFDSDGVLVDTERIFFECTREALAEAGVVLPPGLWARLYLAEGRESAAVAGRLGLPAERVRTALDRRNELFAARLREGVPTMPGAREAVAALRTRVRLAVVTGASRDHLVLAHRDSGLLPGFEFTVTQDDFDRPKPHPDSYLAALARGGLESGECLAVEDSPRGAVAAVAAGIRCLVVPTALTDTRLCPPQAEIVASLAEVVDLVMNGNGGGHGERD